MVLCEFSDNKPGILNLFPMTRWQIFIVLIKVVVLLYLLHYLYQHFFANQSFILAVKYHLQQYIALQQWLYVIAALVLLPVNWLLETYKWYVLQFTTTNHGFYQSWKNVMKGVAYSLFIPQQLGDMAGKFDRTTATQKLGIGVLSLYGGFVQSFMAFAGGMVGVIYLFKPALYMCLFMVIVLVLMVLCLYFMVEIIHWVKKILPYQFLHALSFSMSKKQILLINAIALLRYAVFVVQFSLILQFFSVSINKWVEISAIMLTYFGKTFIPALNILSDVGTREFAALWSFSFTSVSPSIVFIASMLIWCINILIPMLLGAYYLIESMVFSKRKAT